MATTMSFSAACERNHCSKSSADAISIARLMSSGLTLEFARTVFWTVARKTSLLRRRRDGRALHDGAERDGELLSVLWNPRHLSLTGAGNARDVHCRVGSGLMVK